MDDINPCPYPRDEYVNIVSDSNWPRSDADYMCPEEREMEFIRGSLDYIELLPPGLRQCLLQRLSLSYSIMHSPTISLPQEARDCVARPLKLKDWCRLKIKDACPQRAVDHLNLCQPLKEYVTFGLLNPNYASNCMAELNRYTPPSDS